MEHKGKWFCRQENVLTAIAVNLCDMGWGKWREGAKLDLSFGKVDKGTISKVKPEYELNGEKRGEKAEQPIWGLDQHQERAVEPIM